MATFHLCWQWWQYAYLTMDDDEEKYIGDHGWMKLPGLVMDNEVFDDAKEMNVGTHGWVEYLIWFGQFKFLDDGEKYLWDSWMNEIHGLIWTMKSFWWEWKKSKLESDEWMKYLVWFGQWSFVEHKENYIGIHGWMKYLVWFGQWSFRWC